eukprot:TRINITY_DN2255_c0_g1_i1.p1 TRINITY_DN2255_c0_g1~~TRINITY_DN2255_c0_g1_i1.p1  ORF type:complete len:146 (-),score=22.27 TRINITY_DN2255_c0_g1_i1:31-468(-)
MLKNIPSCISPELMHTLMSMGHGDEIVIADGNFPAASHAQKLIRASGVGVPVLLEAIMQFLPLDQYDTNAIVMEVVKGDKNALASPPIWKEYEAILNKHETTVLTPLERFEFYNRAKKAYAIVATSETAIYANIILKKGVVLPKK